MIQQALLWAAAGTGFTFLMTTIGAAMVFFMKRQSSALMQQIFLGFASGVMIAASIWSLLIPAIDEAAQNGQPGWIPAAGGFILGLVLMLTLDGLMPHLHSGAEQANIRELLRLYLEREGYTVLEAENGVEGIKKWKSDKPDMLLLDVMMPVMDGWAVCREIRAESDVPIIMLTAKGETADRVSGLEMGADDYIVKPLEMPEVIARVRAVFRRMAPDDAPEKLSFDNLVIDKQAYDLVIKGKRVDAPPKEIELLYFLASSPNRVFTRAQLLDDVWGFDYFGDTRTVDVHVKRLREKLEGVSDKWELKTVWGVGYKFETKE